MSYCNACWFCFIPLLTQKSIHIVSKNTQDWRLCNLEDNSNVNGNDLIIFKTCDIGFKTLDDTERLKRLLHFRQKPMWIAALMMEWSISLRCAITPLPYTMGNKSNEGHYKEMKQPKHLIQNNTAWTTLSIIKHPLEASSLMQPLPVPLNLLTQLFCFTEFIVLLLYVRYKNGKDFGRVSFRAERSPICWRGILLQSDWVHPVKGSDGVVF